PHASVHTRVSRHTSGHVSRHRSIMIGHHRNRGIIPATDGGRTQAQRLLGPCSGHHSTHLPPIRHHVLDPTAKTRCLSCRVAHTMSGRRFCDSVTRMMRHIPGTTTRNIPETMKNETPTRQKQNVSRLSKNYVATH